MKRATLPNPIANKLKNGVSPSRIQSGIQFHQHLTKLGFCIPGRKVAFPFSCARLKWESYIPSQCFPLEIGPDTFQIISQIVATGKALLPYLQQSPRILSNTRIPYAHLHINQTQLNFYPSNNYSVLIHFQKLGLLSIKLLHNCTLT